MNCSMQIQPKPISVLNYLNSSKFCQRLKPHFSLFLNSFLIVGMASQRTFVNYWYVYFPSKYSLSCGYGLSIMFFFFVCVHMCFCTLRVRVLVSMCVFREFFFLLSIHKSSYNQPFIYQRGFRKLSGFLRQLFFFNTKHSEIHIKYTNSQSFRLGVRVQIYKYTRYNFT